MNYQPLKSMLIGTTAVLGAATTGITTEVGYCDERNGLFFRMEPTGLYVGVRTYTSGTAVETPAFHVLQSAWNIDRMDGTGVVNPSGINLDTTKNQVYVIDFQWLSAGAIRFGIDIAGTIYYVHEITNLNASALPYMQTPNLPVRYRITNDGTGPIASLDQICTAVISEGGREHTGFSLSASTGITPLTTLNDTGIYPLLCMRLLSTSLGATVTQMGYCVCNPTTSLFHYGILLNPTITGTTPTYTTVPNSAVQIATPTNATKITAGSGTMIHCGYYESTNSSAAPTIIMPETTLYLGSNIARVSDVLVLFVQRITGGTEDFYGSMHWSEEV